MSEIKNTENNDEEIDFTNVLGEEVGEIFTRIAKLYLTREQRLNFLNGIICLIMKKILNKEKIILKHEDFKSINNTAIIINENNDKSGITISFISEKEYKRKMN